MKKQIFMTLLVLLGLSQTMKAQTWDFSTLDANDAELMDADNNWYHNTTDKKNRYSYTKALNKEAVKANNQEIAYTKGLLLTIAAVSSGEGNLRAGNDASNKRMWLGSNSVITIPSLKAGMKVTVSCMSSSKDEARGINTENITEVSGDFNKTAKGTAESTNIGTVTADGDVTLTMNGAMYIYLIKVEDPNDTDDEEGGSDDTGGGSTPTTNDLSTSANSMKNQAVLTLKDGTSRYYNTEALQSIDFENANVKVVKDAQTSYTFENTVAGISFNKAEKGESGTVVNEEGAVKITEARGWLESAYVKFEKLESAKSYAAYIKGGQYADYTKIDKELVRDYKTYGRADVVGLTPAENYIIKIVPIDADGHRPEGEELQPSGLCIHEQLRARRLQCRRYAEDQCQDTVYHIEDRQDGIDRGHHQQQGWQGDLHGLPGHHRRLSEGLRQDTYRLPLHRTGREGQPGRHQQL